MEYWKNGITKNISNIPSFQYLGIKPVARNQ